jgi:hypothetical protein
MATLRQYSGGSVDFPYQALSGLEGREVELYCNSLRQRFQRASLLPDAVEEWLVRTYAAAKLILSASVMLSSAKYAADHALRIVEPYLLYYALLNTSRALVLMVPEQSWNDGKLLDETTDRSWKSSPADGWLAMIRAGAVVGCNASGRFQQRRAGLCSRHSLTHRTENALGFSPSL